MFGASRGYPIPPVSAAGSWNKKQAYLLIFMILNFIGSLKQVFLQSEADPSARFFSAIVIRGRCRSQRAGHQFFSWVNTSSK